MVYCLDGVIPGDKAVIAKHCLLETGLVERIIYETFLPKLPITAPPYYGFLQEDDEVCWIFLGQVGGERFSPLIDAHQLGAARWLGRMHSAASRLVPAGSLPQRGLKHYFNHLQTSRRIILESFTNPALGDEDKTVLKTVISQLDFLELNWGFIEQFCEDMPITLVHGDFRPKNIHVRVGPDGIVLFPFDWELAGWGIPAPDLAPASGPSTTHQIDLNEYIAIVNERWPGTDLPMIEKMVLVGHIFRRLAAIKWASLSLEYEWPEKPVSQLQVYQLELAETIQATPWTTG